MKLKTFILSIFVCSSFLSAINIESDPEKQTPSEEQVVYEKIFKEHCHLLKNFEKENKPGLILFSGTPGMGKTWLAKKLESQLLALRISSDEIRGLLRNHNFNPDKRDPSTKLRKLDTYLRYCLIQLETLSPNKLYILDMSIDRTYENILAMTHEKHIPFFIIRLILPREEVEKRLKDKEINQGGTYLPHLNGWFESYEAFGLKNSADFVFDSEPKEAEKNISTLIVAIEKKLNLQKNEKTSCK